MTITSSAENDIVTSRIPNAQNVWIGAEATQTSGAYQRTWAWTGGPDAGTVFTQCTDLLGSCDYVGTMGYSELVLR